MPKVSIIIVDFKKAGQVVRNVESLANQEVNFDIEVIIIDNSCDPGNFAKLKPLKAYGEAVRIYRSEKNLGYIRANNEGARVAKGQYLLICNPDIVWHKKDSLQKMVNFMDKYPRIGICGPKQTDEENQEVAMTVRAWPRLPLQIARRTWLREIPGIKQLVAYDEMRHLNYDETQTVDWLQSSCWMARKDLWDKLGGLSKDYFLFMSDPDLCFQCWEAGFEVVYFPEATVLADGIRASAGGLSDFFKKWTLRQHLKEAITYSFKHLFRGNPHREYLEKTADQ